MRRQTALLPAVMALGLPVLSALGMEGQLSAQPLSEPACPPIVQLEGDSALTAPIALALREHGIQLASQVGCPVIRAQIERRGALLAVRLLEEVQHVDRTVTDLQIATTVIESWVRSDISAPLLASLMPKVPELPAPPMASPSPVSPPPAPPPHRTRFAVELLPEAGVDVAAAGWFGGSLRACTRVGLFCLGVTTRLAAAVPVTQGEGIVDQRLAGDLLAHLELPVRLRRITVSPGLGLGAGFVRHSLSHQVSPVVAEVGEPLMLQQSAIHDGGLRADLRMLTAITLRSGLELALGFSLTAAFLNSDATWVREGHELRLLPATPWGLFRGGLGLRWSTL